MTDKKYKDNFNPSVGNGHEIKFMFNTPKDVEGRYGEFRKYGVGLLQDGEWKEFDWIVNPNTGAYKMLERLKPMQHDEFVLNVGVEEGKTGMFKTFEIVTTEGHVYRSHGEDEIQWDEKHPPPPTDEDLPFDDDMGARGDEPPPYNPLNEPVFPEPTNPLKDELEEGKIEDLINKRGKLLENYVTWGEIIRDKQNRNLDLTPHEKNDLTQKLAVSLFIQVCSELYSKKGYK